MTGLRSHNFHQHYKPIDENLWPQEVEAVEKQHLLDEIYRTTKLWRSSWQHSDGGKRRVPSMIKLIHVEE
jgi:hypothetical protein